MNPVNEIASGGLPHFFMKDIPVKSEIGIELTRPEIYFSPSTAPASYVLVKTNVKEFDYPMGDSNVRSVYAEDGGVSIGSMWRQAALHAALPRHGDTFHGRADGGEPRALQQERAARLP